MAIKTHVTQSWQPAAGGWRWLDWMAAPAALGGGGVNVGRIGGLDQCKPKRVVLFGCRIKQKIVSEQEKYEGDVLHETAVFDAWQLGLRRSLHVRYLLGTTRFFSCDLPADRVSPCLPVVIQIDVVEDVYMPPVNVPWRKRFVSWLSPATGGHWIATSVKRNVDSRRKSLLITSTGLHSNRPDPVKTSSFSTKKFSVFQPKAEIIFVFWLLRATPKSALPHFFSLLIFLNFPSQKNWAPCVWATKMSFRSKNVTWNRPIVMISALWATPCGATFH